MARSTERRRSAILPRRLTRMAILIAFALGFGACTGGSCGSCSSFKQKDFPSEHYDKSVPRSGQVRVTETGLDFLEDEIPTLIQQLQPGGLNFCIPKTTQSVGIGDVTICGEQKCNDGSTGCQLDLAMEESKLTPNPPKTITVDVTIGGVQKELVADPPGRACDVTVHKDGAGNDVPASVPATIPIEFRIDQQSPTNNVTVEAGEVQADLSDIAFEIDGPTLSVCTVGDIGFVKDFLRGQITGPIKEQLNTAVQQILREQTCTKCGSDQPACPMNSSCESVGGTKFCTRNATGKCVSKPLGTEGRLLLSAALGDFMEPEKANVDLMARAADMADVDTGVNIGLRTAFQQDNTRKCAPVDPGARPSFSPIERSMKILSKNQPNTGDPFMVGIGIHENAIEHALWSTWASGATCLRVGSSFSGSLNTDALKLFMPSISNLAESKSPIYLRVAPQTAPEVSLGDNKIEKTMDSYELKEPMMTVDWKNLDLHFYAFVEDRFTRLYTTRLDLELPVGLAPNSKGQIVPVLGNIEEAPKNIRVRNHRLLAEGKEELKKIVPTLLSTALPRLTGSLNEPIDLPSFYGYQLVLKQDDITAVDNEKFLALFANLKPAMQTNRHIAALRPEILSTEVDAETPSGGELPDPSVELAMRSGTDIGVAVPNEDVEYSYRVDGSHWSMFQRPAELEIEHPLLRLEGEHEIEVRARYKGMPATDSKPVSTTVAVDFTAPDLELDRDGRRLQFQATDVVDAPDQLQYRYRVTAADRDETLAGWTSWSDRKRLDLTSLSTREPVEVTVQARDRAGHVTTSSDVFETDPRLLTDPPAGSRGSMPGSSPSTGCSVTGETGTTRGPLGMLWLLLLGGGCWMWRRRRRRLAVLLLGGITAIGLLGGCNNDAAEGGEASCNPACKAWQSCKDGTCKGNACGDNSECPDQSVCADGTCVKRECSSSSDCSCPGDKQAYCDDGQCICDNFCDDGCGESEYCCYAERTCKAFPDPCAEKSCGPGEEAEVSNPGTADRSECTVRGAACECVEKEPLPIDWHGEYTSIDSNASGGDCSDCVVAVSTYNKKYGDLMVGILGDELEPTWYFPDGVPSDGEVTGAPSGPRRGIQDEGADVGTHTAIAVDSSGTLHVFYRNEDEEHLNYARGSGSSGSYEFQTTTVDDQEGSGLYTAATIDGDGTLHAFYGVEDVEVQYEGENVEGSVLRHVSMPADTSFENLSPKPEKVAIGGVRNPCVKCESGEFCFTDGPSCAETSGTCDGGCESGQKCKGGTCTPIFEETSTPTHRLMTGLYTEVVPGSDGLVVLFYDHVERRIRWVQGETGSWGTPKQLPKSTGPYASGAVDSNGDLHLAYMDTDSKTLEYRPPGQNNSTTIIGGTRDTSREFLRAAIGEDVQLWLDSNDEPTVIFQDATRHRFLRAAPGGSGSWTTKPLSKPTESGAYVGGRGFYSSASVAPGADGGRIAVEYVIDQQAEPPEGRLEFLRLK